MQQLEGLGIKFSKTTKYAAVGKKFEDEINKIAEEQELENTIKQYVKDEPAAPGGPGGAPPPMGGPARTPPPGMPGGGSMPGTTPGSTGPAPGGQGIGATPPPPGGPMGESDKTGDGGGSGPSGVKDPALIDQESDIWDHKGRAGNWSASEVEELKELLMEGDTISPFWADLQGPELSTAIAAADPNEVMDVISDFLIQRGYVSSDIRKLKEILDREGILRNIATGDSALIKVEANMPDDSGILNDKQMMDRLSSHIDGGEREPTIINGTPDALLIGHGNSNDGNWSGDISGRMFGDEL